jgi:hypothetical protein
LAVVSVPEHGNAVDDAQVVVEDNAAVTMD